MLITIGVCAFQGAFAEHLEKFRQHFPQVHAIEVRSVNELKHCNGLVLPGGESTAHKTIAPPEFWQKCKRMVEENQLAIWGTCAGSILLCKRVVESDGGKESQGILSLLDCCAHRNFFGRQMQSSVTRGKIKISNYHNDENNKTKTIINDAYPMILIRAPILKQIGEGVNVIGTVMWKGNEEVVVAVQQANVMATTFHPELGDDLELHRAFVDLVLETSCMKQC